MCNTDLCSQMGKRCLGKGYSLREEKKDLVDSRVKGTGAGKK